MKIEIGYRVREVNYNGEFKKYTNRKFENVFETEFLAETAIIEHLKSIPKDLMCDFPTFTILKEITMK